MRLTNSLAVIIMSVTSKKNHTLNEKTYAYCWPKENWIIAKLMLIYVSDIVKALIGLLV